MRYVEISEGENIDQLVVDLGVLLENKIFKANNMISKSMLAASPELLLEIDANSFRSLL